MLTYAAVWQLKAKNESGEIVLVVPKTLEDPFEVAADAFEVPPDEESEGVAQVPVSLKCPLSNALK